MTITVTGPAEHRRMAWANGRGSTVELARREDGEGRLVYRLSVADVVEPGPFSALPGIDRQLLLIEGAGFDLSLDGETASVLPLVPVAFSGDAAVAATALRGPSRDFNVMTGRGLATARLSVHGKGVRHQCADLTFGYVVSGSFDCKGTPVGAAGLVALEGEGLIDISGDGCLVLVDLSWPGSGAD
jgi:environmental stress-induced protein Ves